MSKERARRRAEREVEQARAAAENARRQARASRRRARLARFVPRLRGRPGGLLARRRREQNAIVAVVFILVQVAAWIYLSSWRERLAALVISAFLIPVFVTLAFDRRS